MVYPVDAAIKAYSPMTAEEELTTWQTMPRPVAMKLLVLHNIRLADTMARKYRQRGADFEDLRQIALAGLVRAAEIYDPSRNVKPDGSPGTFANYAYYAMASRLSKACNPDLALHGARTNHMTTLISPTEDGDMALAFERLHGQALTAPRADEQAAKPYLDGIVGNLLALMERDPDGAFPPAARERVAKIVRMAADGMTADDIARALGMSGRATVGWTMMKLRMFLLRQSCLGSPELKDLGYLFEKSYWMRCGKSMLGGEEPPRAGSDAATRMAKGINSAVESMPYQERLRSGDREGLARHVRRKMRTAVYIPYSPYRGRLKPVVSVPEYGHFYTTAAWERYAVRAGTNERTRPCP